MIDQITDAAITHIDQEVGPLHASRLRNLQAWLREGMNPYAVTKYEKTHDAAALQTRYAELPTGEATADSISVAGRIVAIRNSGMFIVLQDASGRIQLFNNVKTLTPEAQVRLARLDLGDMIGARGIIRRTPRGELTIDLQDYILLTKALEPMPEKYHGIADPELESRERHKSIATDDDVKHRLINRCRIVAALRRTLDDEGFLDVETPSLHPIAGGAAAQPFTTHHNALDMQLFLRIAPELYLKRLIASGISEKVFEIGKNFRNEGVSPKHNPEFTSLEAYVAYANFEDMMNLVERLVLGAVTKITGGSTKVTFDGQELDFATPWPRRAMADLVKEHTGVDFVALSASEALAAARKLGVHAEGKDSWGKILEKVFGDKVEHQLRQPTHVTDLPTEVSPLAKPNPANPRLAERFETYVAGWEIANAFSELNDPFIQHHFFKQQAMNRLAGDAEATLPDDDYVKVLEFGLPPTGGLGIGIDRLVMLLTDARHIRQVILFPTLRPDNNPRPSVSSVLDPVETKN